MSHLHVPDGVLPPLLWAPALVLALLLLALSARFGNGARAGNVEHGAGSDAPGGHPGGHGAGFRGALGALMLAVMTIPIPLFALEYCLTLAGPVGVLLGAGGSVQVAFVVCVVLAFLGQGGFSVVGLNVLVLAAGMAVARPAYRAVLPRLGPAGAMAVATAAAQALSGALWFALLALALRIEPRASLDPHGHASVLVFSGLAIGMWALAIAAESLVGFGIGRFLARVRPDLLPGGGPS